MQWWTKVLPDFESHLWHILSKFLAKSKVDITTWAQTTETSKVFKIRSLTEAAMFHADIESLVLIGHILCILFPNGKICYLCEQNYVLVLARSMVLIQILKIKKVLNMGWYESSQLYIPRLRQWGKKLLEKGFSCKIKGEGIWWEKIYNLFTVIEGGRNAVLSLLWAY